MRVALAQVNLTIGDFAGNLRKIREALVRARAERAELVILPELGISGYPPGDLLERPSFLRDHTRALEELVPESRDIAILTGAILPAPDGGPKRISNSAVLLDRGEIAHVQAKTLLPTYDIFDESRYFQPASDRRVAPPQPAATASMPSASRPCISMTWATACTAQGSRRLASSDLRPASSARS